MKNTKLVFWIITAIFSAFMLFSAIPDVLLVPDALTFMHHLGYPNYFSQFLGVAKVLGIIAILIPGFPRIKEWAYAGLAYDLIGATYSQLATDGFQPGIFFMALPLLFLAASYILHHKLNS
jgi:hypothetical protein